MAKKTQKYYVVWKGAKPGVYESWNDCNAQIRGFPGARYKSFSNLELAKKAFLGSPADYIGQGSNSSEPKKINTKGVIWKSLSVDAACSGSPGIMEYRGVWTDTKDEVFRKGPFQYATNNIGEFLALVHGIAFLQQHQLDEIPIYSDSRTAISWLRNKKIKTTLERLSINVDVFHLLDRAEKWMNTNQWQNQIMKWETDKWGEIPADFGRK